MILIPARILVIISFYLEIAQFIFAHNINSLLFEITENCSIFQCYNKTRTHTGFNNRARFIGFYRREMGKREQSSRAFLADGDVAQYLQIREEISCCQEYNCSYFLIISSFTYSYSYTVGFYLSTFN